MSRVALVISLVAILIALWSAGQVTIWAPEVAATPVPGMSRAWGGGVVLVLRDLDRRLTAVEREVFLHTDEPRKP